MLVKIKSKTSGKKAVKMLLRYLFKEPSKLIEPISGKNLIITHNLVGHTPDEWEKEFLENEQYRKVKRKNSVWVTHEVISFHPKDEKHLDIAKLRTIAEEYINNRGRQGMYVMCAHFDRRNIHLHACVSGIAFRAGTSMRLSKSGLRDFQKRLQEMQIERFPELSASRVNLDQAPQRNDKVFWLKKRGLKPKKEKVHSITKRALMMANQQDDFIREVERSGLKFYQRGEKSHGVIYKGKKYRIKTLGLMGEWNSLEQRERDEKVNERGRRGRFR